MATTNQIHSPNALEVTEYSTLKASYELLNKTYRKCHREMEREVSSLNKTFEDIDCLDTVGDAARFLDRVINGVNCLKRKADITFHEENRVVQGCKRRIDHLSLVSQIHTAKQESKTSDILVKNEPITSESSVETSPKFRDSSNLCRTLSYQRLNRLLADHLFTCGHYDSAIQLSESSCSVTTPCSDSQDCEEWNLCLVDIYKQSQAIEISLRNGDTSLAHQWCQDCNFKLKKMESNFEFELRIFEFYLLLKKNKSMEAVAHSRKYLCNVKCAESYQALKLKKAMYLLLVKREKLQEMSNRNELSEDWIVSRFRAVNLEFYNFKTLTSFSVAVKAGISVIKSHDCYQESTQKPNCIVCHKIVNKLAETLPYGKHDHSLLTCWKTGKPMNDDNPPMALPNGYVYSKEGLSELSEDEKIHCPRSGEIFSSSEAQRVYIV